MALLEDLADDLLAKLKLDTQLNSLFNNKLVFRHGKGAGSDKFSYLVWDFEDKGSKDNTPIQEGYLFVDIWTYNESTRQAQQIITRLKHCLHRKYFIKNNGVWARSWWMGQVQVLTDTSKVDDQAVRHFRTIWKLRFFDLELLEAELTD